VFIVASLSLLGRCHHLFLVLLLGLDVSASDVLPLALPELSVSTIREPSEIVTYAAVGIIPQLVHALVEEATTLSAIVCSLRH
jgi:hypothetical protein